jgi:virginiamycin B lyase
MRKHMNRRTIISAAAAGGLLIGAWLAAGGTRLQGANATVERRPMAAPDPSTELSSSAVLAMLPDGEAKRKFVLDCTGCHQFDQRIAFPGGQPRTQEQWEAATRRMLGYAGATTPFPVISAERDPVATAQWLAQHLASPSAAAPAAPAAARAEITEFDFPVAQDLPHDVMVDSAGQVVITGMFTHKMWTLDPGTGRFAEIPVPVPNANPRALDIDTDGTWWVLLGAPQKIARYTPARNEWKSFDIGMYPHSIQKDRSGRIWFNGHFTREPELIGYLDAATGAVRTFEVPNTPELRAGAGPIPYDLRIAPDGSIWGTELHGNRIFRFAPDTETFATWTMPTPHRGPRRVDFDRQGGLWVAEYAGNKLTRFDPKTERFRVYPLPTRGALIRHMDIDPRTGDLWAAYGAAPGIPPKIVRVRAAA